MKFNFGTLKREKRIELKKIVLLTSLLLFFVFTTNKFAQDSTDNPHPKIGLVLSGGGARGFAHIGTLKLLDSLKIPNYAYTNRPPVKLKNNQINYRYHLDIFKG